MGQDLGLVEDLLCLSGIQELSGATPSFALTEVTVASTSAMPC